MEFNLKRLLSFAVALVMVLTMVPFDGLQVFATEVKSGTYDRPQSDDPKINAIMLNADRIRTESQTAYEGKWCPKCQKPVTWKILSKDGSIDVANDANLHLYVPAGTYKHTSDKDDSGKVINAHGYAPINFVGATAGVKCSVCDEVIVEPTVIPKKGEEFTVKFVVPYGVEYKASENIYDNYPEVLTAPVYEGYTFEGWSTVPVSKTETKPAMVELLDGKYDADGNITLYAVFSSSETTAGTEGGFKAATEIAVGDTVYLVCESKTMQLSGISDTDTKYGNGTKYADSPAKTYALTVEEGSPAGTYAFKAPNGQYLYWTSGNSLATNASLTANTSWTVTFDGDNAIIANAADSSRKLQWNASSPRFACYTSKQTAVQLYKEHVATPGTTTYNYFTADEYTVTFVTPAGVTAPAPVTVIKDTTVELNPVAAPEGATATFAGWATVEAEDVTEVQLVNNSFVPTDDVTLYAVYSYEVEGNGKWNLVTSASSLKAGDQIVIVAMNAAYAMSTTQNNNNRAQVAVTKNSDNTVTINNDVQIIELVAGSKDDTFGFKVGSGYLYAASSSANHLKTQDKLDANASWSITVASSGVATVKAQGNYTRNWLRYNSTSNPKIFACYGSGQADIALYKMTTSVTYYTTAPSTDPCYNGHTIVQVEAKEKTCTEAGWEAYEYCSKCDYTTKVEIPAGHELVNVEAKASTCKEQGWNAYEYCSECDYTTKELLPLAEHTPGEKEVVDEVAADCTNDGYYEYVICCTACETELERKTVTVTAEGHDYQVSEVVAPDFDVQGYTVNTCTVCGDSYNNNFTDALIAVAQIGEKLYESFAEAVEKAAAGDEIVLLANAEFSGYADVVINLNGYTLTGEVAATLKMNGGTLVTTKTPHTMAAPSGAKYNTTDAIIAIEPNGNITIVEGTVTLGESWWTGEGQTLTIAEDATFKIPAGLNLNVLSTVKVEGKAEVEGTITLYIASATIESATEIANVVTNIADHKVVYENGVYKVIARNYVAQVGTQKFESLADAIAAAGENATVVVIADHKVTEPVVIEKNIIIDLNGKTLTAKDIYPVIRVQGGANVTVKNGNIINANDYVFVLGSSDKATAGNLTIESGEYVGETTVASVTKGVLTITGGKFAVSESEYGATYLINCYDANLKNGTAKIVVSGGTFVGFNPEENAAENPAVDFTADGYIGVEDGNGNYIVREGVWVAKIGEKKFETLQAAAGAAVAGDTIVLLTDVAYTGYINNDVVVDLNGKTLTGELSATLKMNGGYLVTAKYAMAGPDNSKYITTDAVMTLLPNGDMTVISGTIELADADWWTLAGQTVTIAKDATFVIPAGKNLNVQGAVIVEGTAIVNGTATLYNTEATIEAAAGMNVVSAVAGKKVAYKNGVYCLIDENVLAWNESTGAEFETVEAALAAAKAGETVKLMGDAVEDAFFVRANIALDLNGFKLTANYVAAMPGSDVIDSSADSTGVLVVDENGFAYAPDNKQLVIKTPDGYRFVDAAPRLVLKQEGEQYKVSVSMTKDGTTDILFAQLIKQYKIENLDLQFRVNVAWTDTIYGEYDLGFRFKDSLAQEAMDICAERGAYTMGMYMYINGAAGLENLTFTGEVVVLDGNGKEIQTITGETIPAVAP